jgi:preprotein translocase subunit YajC
LIAFLLTTTSAVLAQTTAPTSQPAPGWAQAFGNPLFLFAIIIMVFMLMTTRGKKRQERERTDMLSGMKRGDRVQTIGGILGKVVDVEDQKILVKVDESSNTKIWFRRDAIHRVIGDDVKAEAASK